MNEPPEALNQTSKNMSAADHEFETWWDKIYECSGGGPSPNGKFLVIKESIRNAFRAGYHYAAAKQRK